MNEDKIRALVSDIETSATTLSSLLFPASATQPESADSATRAGTVLWPSHRSCVVVVPSHDKLMAAGYPADKVNSIRDWRVCPAENDTWCKYSGGIQQVGDTMIQVNGVSGEQYYLEAVDALGPFVSMAGMAGMVMTAGTVTNPTQINGHGDNTNPRVLFRFGPITLTSLSEEPIKSSDWSFNFDLSNWASIPRVVRCSADPTEAASSGKSNQIEVVDATYALFSGGNARFEHHGTMVEDTHVFVDHGHLMTTVRAGIKTAPDTANSSLLIQPMAGDNEEFVIDLSDGSTWDIRVSFVGHQNDRQWGEIWLTEPGVRVVNGGKFDHMDQGNNVATVGGTRDTGSGGWLLRWKPTIVHYVAIFEGGKKVLEIPNENRFEPFSLTERMARCRWYATKYPALGTDGKKMANGFDGDHDLQHEFKLTISKNGYEITEIDPIGNQIFYYSDNADMAGIIPDKVCVRFRHAVYHPVNNLTELSDSELLWKLKLHRGDMTDTQHWNLLRITRR